jgi:nucleoside-diphosphate-sugar epimerase
MRYLILGSEGQIGKYLVQYVRQKNHDVIEYDIRRDGYEDLRLCEPNAKFKRQRLERCMANCDFVFFLAWDVGGSKYLSDAESSFSFIHNNTAIMNSTFYMLKKHNKPFVFTSSQMAAMAHSPYGNTKMVGERFTKALNGISVRLWNVYGYEKVDKRSHVITDFMEMALSDGVIKMRTDGSETRQFLYVEDCCEALFALSRLYNSISRNEEFHVSSYVWTPIEYVAEIISRLCKCEYIKGELSDSVQLSLQEEPNENILKYWKPKTSIIEGIKCIIKKTKNSQD